MSNRLSRNCPEGQYRLNGIFDNFFCSLQEFLLPQGSIIRFAEQNDCKFPNFDEYFCDWRCGQWRVSFQIGSI